MSLSLRWRKVKKFLFRLLLIFVAVSVIFVIYLDAQIKDEFKQQAWNIPAKVFARPLAFSKGESLAINDLILELELLGYRKKIKATSQGEYERYENTLVIYTRDFKFWDGDQPAQVLEVTIDNQQISALRDFASGKQVNFLRLDPLLLGNIQAANQEDRVLVTLNQLPAEFLPALLNTEDRDFYQHWGLSAKGIARAAWRNLSEGEVTQGGSTLTQQLMKNHFLSRERSLWRKAREAVMALLMEVHYEKPTILQAYINEVYLGQNQQVAIHGFGRASQFYFDRPLNKLSLSQVALLVGMVKGPSYYNPRRNPERALQRRNLVLTSMRDNGLISDADHKDAMSRGLQVVAKPQQQTSQVPAFMGFIKRELNQVYSNQQLRQEGLRLFTTLDPVVQRKAETALSSRLGKIERARRLEENSLQGALIVSDVKSGDILAMVGDRQANYVGFNRAIDAYRQTGSVIKPFVYLAALSRPERFSVNTPILDEPFSLEGTDGSLWSPKNYDKKVHGQIPLAYGLINSYNLATARLALEVGVEEVASTIQQAGFERKLSAYPSIALGSKAMSVLEVSRLYQTLANNGVGINSSGLIAVQDQASQLLQRYPRTADARLDAEAAFIVKHLLGQVVNQGTAKQIGQTFGEDRYAGKTGTTNDLRDSWYAGFGGDRLAVVWLGRDDNQPSQLTGATGALQVWRDLWLSLEEPAINPHTPEGIVWGYKEEGLLSLFRSCKTAELLPFYADYLPAELAVCETN